VLDVQEDGLLDLAVLKAALRPDTTLVSVMLVNNEIGVIQDIAAIGALCRERGVLLHVDAAQASGKVAIDLGRLPVDLMSLSAHKTYGPKGVGALYVRRKPRVRIEALIHGGGHERGMRSGTLPTHQIVGMGEAYRLAARRHGAENERIRGCATACWPGCRHPRDARQRQPGAARAAQPEHQLPVRRRRVAADGHEGHCGVVGLGLHQRQPGAQLRAARAGPVGRGGAQLDPLFDRPLHHGRRDRRRHRPGQGHRRAPARA
jgi:cysteine sulfinate desulfinase/cysteine desulfurase-like protein